MQTFLEIANPHIDGVGKTLVVSFCTAENESTGHSNRLCSSQVDKLRARLRGADVALDVELTAQPVHDDVKVQLAHALNHLWGRRVGTARTL